MTQHDSKLLKITQNYSKLLNITQHDSKLLNITQHDSPSQQEWSLSLARASPSPRNWILENILCHILSGKG